MHTQIQIIGCLLIGLAFVHIPFPKYFQWKKQLQSLSLINRQIFSVHTFFIALTVFLMGVLCLVSTDELVLTKLGKTICFGLGLFWATRFIFQLFVYSPKLWKGKIFETYMHILFSSLWVYFTVVFFWVYSS